MVAVVTVIIVVAVTGSEHVFTHTHRRSVRSHERRCDWRLVCGNHHSRAAALQDASSQLQLQLRSLHFSSSLLSHAAASFTHRSS